MADLLDLVDQLTKPRVEHIAIKDDDGKWVRTHSVEHPGLLVQFRDTASPTAVNNGGGNSALPSERNMLDLSAMHEYAKIAQQIASWCHMYQVGSSRDPVVDLRRWYAAWVATESESTFYIRMLRSWVDLIQGYFDPPKRFTIPAPCPVCGTSSYGDAINGGAAWPIEVMYWFTESGDIDRAKERAVCRKCVDVVGSPTVWAGHEAVVELADELKEKRAV